MARAPRWLFAFALCGAGLAALASPAFCQEFVIPPGREAALRELFGAAWTEAPPVAIVTARIEREVVVVEMRVHGAAASLRLVHPRDGRAHAGESVDGAACDPLRVRLECAACDGPGRAALQGLAKGLLERARAHGFQLWQRAGAPGAPGEDEPRRFALLGLCVSAREVALGAALVLLSIGLAFAILRWRRRAAARRRAVGALALDAEDARWSPFLGFVAALLRREPLRGARAIVALDLLAVACVLAFAWPALFAPIGEGTAAYRVGIAHERLFGDAGHPFLSFALLRPFVAISLEPWTVRLAPLLFLLAEALLLRRAAERAAGPLAGVLAVLWLAVEVPRRHGLADVSDWDLAGAFTLALFLWLEREEVAPSTTPRRLALLLALLAGGLASSWLFVLPGAAVALLLVAKAVRRRPGAALAAGATLVLVAVAAVQAGLLYEGFFTDRPALGAVLGELFAETPLGRSLAMAAPLALGVAWLARARRSPPALFAAASIVLVYAEVPVVALTRHHSGYYVGLVTPLVLLAAAAGTARALSGLVDLAREGFGGDGSARFSARLPAIGAVLGLVAAFLLAVPASPSPALWRMDGAEHLGAFVARVLSAPAPIATPLPDLGRVLAYDRARRGELRPSALLAEAPGEDEDLRRGGDPGPGLALAPFDGAACAPRRSPAAAFYVVLAGLEVDPCFRRVRERCEALFAPARRFSYFVCAPASLTGPSASSR